MTTRTLRIMVDVDDLPRDRWPIDGSAILVLRGRRFTVEKVGCCLCVEQEGSFTLCHADAAGVESFLCMEHGELVAVPYSMKKVYTITIGDVVREGEELLEDSMLFTEEMTLVARNELINRLLDEAVIDEQQAGAAPTE